MHIDSNICLLNRISNITTPIFGEQLLQSTRYILNESVSVLFVVPSYPSMLSIKPLPQGSAVMKEAIKRSTHWLLKGHDGL